MDDATKILVDNLRESFRTTQKYILWGLGSALLTLLLIQQMPKLNATKEAVKIPWLGNADPMSAGFVFMFACFIFGILAFGALMQSISIYSRIENHEIKEAVVTFPSLITSNKFIRVGSVVISPVLFLIAYAIEHNRDKTEFNLASLVGLILFCSPYLVLAFKLWKPFSEMYVKKELHI